MSGYGSPDDEAIHAAILAENAIHAARAHVYTGMSAKYCTTCGEPIPESRRVALPGVRQCTACRTIEEKQK